MNGWIKINNSIHGTAYFRDISCCGNVDLRFLKSKNVKSRNSQEDYYECPICGQMFMEQNQEFICMHNDNKKSYDLSYSIYIKKRKSLNSELSIKPKAKP